ncbi:MAG: hypothetical protein ACKOK8_05175, partial [Planctomycetia bacterium]
PGHRRFDGLGSWAEPDVRHLAELMRQIATGGDDLRGRAMANAERVRRLYPVDSLVDGVWRIWNETAAASRGSTP